MQHFLAVTTGHYKAIIILMVLTAALSAYFGVNFNKTAFSSTAFITIGAKERDTASPYETAQAADHFSELVQGWFKNQTMLDKIAVNAGYRADFNARKQEKQNLVVTYRTPTQEEAKKVADAMNDALNDGISSYNINNVSKYNLAAFSFTTKENPVPLFLFIAAGLVAGFGVGFVYGSASIKIKSELRQFARSKK